MFVSETCRIFGNNVFQLLLRFYAGCSLFRFLYNFDTIIWYQIKTSLEVIKDNNWLIVFIADSSKILLKNLH